MRTGYKAAIDLALTELEKLAPADVCSRTGCTYENGAYSIPWFGEKSTITEGSEWDQIVKLHYLTSKGASKPSQTLISYREVPSALFYEPKFIARAVRPVVKTFGANAKDLITAAAAIQGTQAPHGDAAVTLTPLPNIQITYILWQGDDEFPPDGNILFDKNSIDWLPAEDLVVLASIASYKLLQIAKKP